MTGNFYLSRTFLSGLFSAIQALTGVERRLARHHGTEFTLMPQWAQRNHLPRGNSNTGTLHQRDGLCCPQSFSDSPQLVLSSFLYFQICPKIFPATQKGAMEHTGESLESLCQFTHPGLAVQTMGQCWGLGRAGGVGGGQRRGCLGEFSYLGQDSSVPDRGIKFEI